VNTNKLLNIPYIATTATPKPSAATSTHATPSITLLASLAAEPLELAVELPLALELAALDAEELADDAAELSAAEPDDRMAEMADETDEEMEEATSGGTLEIWVCFDNG
jgi:hypothetical protein